MDLLRISRNIRSLRQKQGMTLDQLAIKSGFSKGFLSQVENFRLTPSVKALNKLADALGIELGQLFQQDSTGPEYTFGRIEEGEEVVRDESTRFGIDYHALAYRQIDRALEPFLIEYLPAAEFREFKMHDSEEFYWLLEGEVDFYILDDANVTRMRPGDTLYLRANLPHRVQLAEGCPRARAFSVYAKGK